MASFSINCSRVKSQIARLEAIARELQSMNSDVLQIGRALSLEGAASNTVRRAVKAYAAEVTECKAATANVAQALNEIVTTYSNTENNVRSNDQTKGNSSDSKVLPKGEIPMVPYISPRILAMMMMLLSKNKPSNGKVTSGALLSGALSGEGSFFDIPISGKLYGELLGASYKVKHGLDMKIGEKDGQKYLEDLGIGASISGEAHLAKGKAEGSLGVASGKMEAEVGEISAQGGVGASLFKDGKLSPQAYAKAGAKVTGAKGSIEGQIGSDDNNVHANASGEVLTAEAKAEAAAGKITYKDEVTGEDKSAYGVKGSAGAEAYAASGKVSGGFSIFGVKINIGVSGHAGGAGGKIGGYAGTGGVGGSISAGLGIGAGIDLSIDWSGLFK